MFQFNRFAHLHPFFKWIGFPIQKSTDQFIFADPRSLSQLITSFIASESQGIPRVPFLTFFYDTAFCSVCMLFLILVASFSSLVHLFISSLVLLPMYLCPHLPVHLRSLNSPLLLSSLSIYFFQYVKELLPRSSLQIAF